MATNKPHPRDVPFMLQDIVDTQDYQFQKLYRSNIRNYSSISDILNRIATLEKQANYVQSDNPNKQSLISLSKGNEDDSLNLLIEENTRLKGENISLKNQNAQFQMNNNDLSIPHPQIDRRGSGVEQGRSPDNAVQEIPQMQMRVQELEKQLHYAREEIASLKQGPVSMDTSYGRSMPQDIGKEIENRMAGLRNVNPDLTLPAAHYTSTSMHQDATQSMRQDGLESTQSNFKDLEGELQSARNEIMSLKQNQVRQEEFIQTLLKEKKNLPKPDLDLKQNSNLEKLLEDSRQRGTYFEAEYSKLYAHCEEQSRIINSTATDKQGIDRVIRNNEQQIYELQQKIQEKQDIIDTHPVAYQVLESDFAKIDAELRGQVKEVSRLKEQLEQKEQVISDQSRQIAKEKNEPKHPYPMGASYLPPSSTGTTYTGSTYTHSSSSPGPYYNNPHP